MAVKDTLSLWPLGGFINSVPRMDVPLNCLTGASRDWLVGRRRLRRRPGSAPYAGSDVSGVLESKWGARCRRLHSVALGSLADGFPTVLGLFVNEVTKAATLSFRSTNGSGSWRTFGREFGEFHYPPPAPSSSVPTDNVPRHRVIPMVYRNEYGGLTLHRLTTAEHRKHMAAGSRSLMLKDGGAAWGGYDSIPAWCDGGFNDSATAGSQPYHVQPLGLVMPLGMPNVAAGTSLGASVVGPWKGSDAYFVSCIGETFDGELSMFALPRPHDSAYPDYPGYGYVHVDPTNPTFYYSSMVWTNIPVLPPQFRWVHLLRSNKVSVLSSDSDASFPSIGSLQFCGRVANGVTTYIDTEGNDFSLTPDSRIGEMWKGGLQWPPCSRYMGGFDGRKTLGCLRPNPAALVMAPWKAGAVNAKIDDASLYGATSYDAAVMRDGSATKDCLVVREVVDGVVTKSVEYPLAGQTLRSMADRINTTSVATSTTLACSYGNYINVLYSKLDFAALKVGMAVSGYEIPVGTVITGFTYYANPPGGASMADYHYWIRVSKNPTLNSVTPPNTSIVTFEVLTASTGGANGDWASQVVPGADGYADADSLLRTLVVADAQWENGATVIELDEAGDVPYVTPGMGVYLDGAFPDGAIVTDVDADTRIITVDKPALRANTGMTEFVTFAYSTGDVDPGYVRAYGNAFPLVFYFGLTYLDQFKPSKQATMFSVGSPGYAQDALNTWMVKNRRGGLEAFGDFMAFADLGPIELRFFAKGRMRLANVRTGESHIDEDYTAQTVSWTRGACSPYAACNGSGWAIAADRLGLYVCGDGFGEKNISGNVFDASAPEGERGELEYAIAQSVIASESGSDDFKISFSVHDGVLRVRYYSGPSATYFDRELRYDFSLSLGRSGPAEVLRADGSAYPWSPPMTLRHSCSAEVVDATGRHLYAAVDDNAGVTDGRVDEVDVGTTDNGKPVKPIGYTGLAWPPGLNLWQVLRLRVLARKAGSGLGIGLARTPSLPPEETEYDRVSIPTSGDKEFVRHLPEFGPLARLGKDAVGLCIYDDGRGPCPEVTLVTADVSERESVTPMR